MSPEQAKAVVLAFVVVVGAALAGFVLVETLERARDMFDPLSIEGLAFDAIP